MDTIISDAASGDLTSKQQQSSKRVTKEQPPVASERVQTSVSEQSQNESLPVALSSSDNSSLVDLAEKFLESDLVTWRTLLQAPAVSESAFQISGLDKTDTYPPFIRAIRVELLLSLGATPAQAFGCELSKYWTLQPAALELLLNGIVARLPKTELQLQDELTALVPQVNPMDLISVLEGEIQFSRSDGLWTRKD